MPTIRDQILRSLVARIAALDGWTAALRRMENPVTRPRHAIVAQTSETKAFANSSSYDATLSVEVDVVCAIESADPVLDVDDSGTGAANPFRFLDRSVADIERVIHAPDAWGVNPDFTDVVCTGHEVLDPSEENELIARVFLTFRYRHDAFEGP